MTPIVLHHGLFGFGNFELGRLRLSYFHRIDRAIAGPGDAGEGGRMTRRCLASIAALTAVIALVAVAPVPIAGQTPASDAKAKAGPALKTAWGAPDLQGIWGKSEEVPLQRPTKFAKKEFFTDAERAELDKQRAGILGRDAAESRRKVAVSAQL